MSQFPPVIPKTNRSASGCGSILLKGAIGCFGISLLFSCGIGLLGFIFSYTGANSKLPNPPAAQQGEIDSETSPTAIDNQADPQKLMDDFQNIVQAGDTTAVAAWLKAHPKTIDAQFDDESTLETICKSGTPAMLDAYESAGGSLKWKSKPNVIDGEAVPIDPPLFAVVQWQYNPDNLLAMVDRLIGAGASINDEGPLGNCLTNLEMNSGLEKNLPARSKILDHLLQLGANINDTGIYNGSSALDSAALFGDAQFVQLLLARGANVNIAGKANLNNPEPDPNYTPLFVAREELAEIEEKDGSPETIAKYQATIDLLRQHGGIPTEQDFAAEDKDKISGSEQPLRMGMTNGITEQPAARGLGLSEDDLIQKLDWLKSVFPKISRVDGAASYEYDLPDCTVLVNGPDTNLTRVCCTLKIPTGADDESVRRGLEKTAQVIQAVTGQGSVQSIGEWLAQVGANGNKTFGDDQVDVMTIKASDGSLVTYTIERQSEKN